MKVLIAFVGLVLALIVGGPMGLAEGHDTDAPESIDASCTPDDVPAEAGPAVAVKAPSLDAARIDGTCLTPDLVSSNVARDAAEAAAPRIDTYVYLTWHDLQRLTPRSHHLMMTFHRATAPGTAQEATERLRPVPVARTAPPRS